MSVNEAKVDDAGSAIIVDYAAADVEAGPDDEIDGLAVQNGAMTNQSECLSSMTLYPSISRLKFSLVVCMICDRCDSE